MTRFVAYFGSADAEGAFTWAYLEADGRGIEVAPDHYWRVALALALDLVETHGPLTALEHADEPLDGVTPPG